MVHVILYALLIIVGTFLLLDYDAGGGRRRLIVEKTAADEHVQRRARSYSTSDEMRYILYGVGDSDRFTPDHRQLIDYIRDHITQPSPSRTRRLRSRRKDASQEGQSAFVGLELGRVSTAEGWAEGWAWASPRHCLSGARVGCHYRRSVGVRRQASVWTPRRILCRVRRCRRRDFLQLAVLRAEEKLDRTADRGQPYRSRAREDLQRCTSSCSNAGELAGRSSRPTRTITARCSTATVTRTCCVRA